MRFGCEAIRVAAMGRSYRWHRGHGPLLRGRLAGLELVRVQVVA
jgi:hypothetical protein